MGINVLLCSDLKFAHFYNFHTISEMDVQKKIETIDEIPAEKIVSTESVDESRITEDPIDIPMEEDEQDDKLNDSSNSVLATPLEPDEELEDIKSVPSSLNEEADEIPKGNIC